ncbi:DsbA family protein [Oceaniglobus indicus]|uniref:DsbA family protein n=1 Tax=Oceaniglobus indicus TaxID=2047749 RepID=UPI000C1941A2|nr:DsbA family protein [Oceaniglobus indicus]
MSRLSLSAFALALGLATPVLSEGLTDMTPAERAAFGTEVRAYLLENPQVLMEAIAVLEQRQANEQAVGDAQLLEDNADALFNDGHSYVAGNPEGDVTMVEFIDYRCGYCRKAHPEVAELLARDGNIRLIVKEFPILGDESVLASRFALSVKKVAGDAAYGTIYDALMNLRADVTEASLRALAEDSDLDGDAIMAGMDDPEIDRIIAANRALGQTLRINGTPSFVFGDQMVRGYVPLDTMEQLVAAQRDE